jgi:hypothetical protein
MVDQSMKCVGKLSGREWMRVLAFLALNVAIGLGIDVQVDSDLAPNVCKNTLAAAEPVYHGELLITDVVGHLPAPGPGFMTQQHVAYKYSWIAYTDASLSTIYYQRSPATRLDMGHKFRANLPAMAYVKAFVWNSKDDLLGECYIGPVQHVGKDEQNAIVDANAKDIGRVFSRVDCNVPLCRKTIKNVVYKCDFDNGFVPELYQPNKYESRHRCVERE